MTNLINGIMQDAKIVILGAIILNAMAFVIMTWNRTKSLVPTIGAALMGAVVIASVASYTVLRREVEDDIDRYTATTNPPLGVPSDG